MSKVIAESKGSCLHGREIKERGGEGERKKKKAKKTSVERGGRSATAKRLEVDRVVKLERFELTELPAANRGLNKTGSKHTKHTQQNDMLKYTKLKTTGTDYLSILTKPPKVLFSESPFIRKTHNVFSSDGT